LPFTNISFEDPVEEQQQPRRDEKDVKMPQQSTKPSVTSVNVNYNINVPMMRPTKEVKHTTHPEASSLEQQFENWAKDLSGCYKRDIKLIWSADGAKLFHESKTILDKENFEKNYRTFLTDGAQSFSGRALTMVRKQQRSLQNVTLLDIVMDSSCWTDFNGLVAQLLFQNDQQNSQATGRYQTAKAMTTTLVIVQDNVHMHLLAFNKCRFDTFSRKFTMIRR
jgi:hypothetical protein